MVIEIHYRNDYVRELYEKSGIQTDGSAGFDLICVEDVTLNSFGQFQMIDLGVIIKPPKLHHSLLMPRSSTFKKYGIIQTNSIGLIDEDYCGPEDYWMFPSLYMRHDTTTIKSGTRLVQFILQKTIPIITSNEYIPKGYSRGGFGSTGD